MKSNFDETNETVVKGKKAEEFDPFISGTPLIITKKPDFVINMEKEKLIKDLEYIKILADEILACNEEIATSSGIISSEAANIIKCTVVTLLQEMTDVNN